MSERPKVAGSRPDFWIIRLADEVRADPMLVEDTAARFRLCGAVATRIETYPDGDVSIEGWR
jgi:hypothetical protein